MFVFVNHDDMRSLELCEVLLHRGYYVSDEFKDLKYADVIYLGAKGIDRKNRLLTHQETKILDNHIFQSLKKNCLVMTLVHNQYLSELANQYQFFYKALLDEKEFIEKNSILTAEGLMSYVIMHRRYPIYKSSVLVLGFGHCAKPIIDYFLAFKADVYVGVRNLQLREQIEDLGCHFVDIEKLDLSKIDILINTIPNVIVKKNELEKANSKIMIVDIASYPYGIDHHYAVSKGMNSQILSAIPCKYAYGYAGEMIADVIEREIKNA